MAELRTLVLVLGDQLDLEASAFDGFDAQLDAVWMAEVVEESTQVWSSQPRSALFLAAMRHFALALRAAGRPLHYTALDDAANAGSLAGQLAADIARLRPQALVMTAPGDWRVLQAMRQTAAAAGLPLEVREDRHFFCTLRDFRAHAQGRRQLRMEFFYREMRRRHGVLLTPAGEPEGGQWNYDADNRKPFGAQGPDQVPPRVVFQPDAITNTPVLPIGEVQTAFYLRLVVADQAGVLARITTILAEHDISIDAVLQRESAEGERQTDVIILTHDCREAAMNGALAQMQALPTVLQPIVRIRKEELA